MKCYMLQLTTPHNLTTFHFSYHTTNVFAIFLPVFTQYQLKFLVLLAKRFADDHNIPYSSRYLRNIVPSLPISPYRYHNPEALSGPTASPIQWLPGTFPGVKRTRRGANHPPHLTPRLKKA